MRTDIKPKLKLIRGGQQCEMDVKSVHIFIAPERRPPFRVDAIAAEEDTFLVMSEGHSEVCDKDEHPVRIMTRAIEARPALPGSVLVRSGNPLRLLAIIHDFDKEPSWKEEWVFDALCGIFGETEKRRIHSLALPMIGTVHGTLKEDRFLYLLHNALEGISPDHLKKLWLVVPDGSCCEIFGKFELVTSR